MTDTQDQPLWRVMDRAAYPKPQPRGHSYRAAEIRAVADWLVPAGLEKLRPDDPVERIKWRTALKLRQRLLTEADRAERGDG